ncbi:MAG TPA: COR domain-containing protein [Actinocrinis sp.]|nr:COR domain-containing protein [Actinocrinis sp.]
MTHNAFALADERIELALKNRSTSLDLSDLGLDKLPKSLSSLTELQSLSVRRNRLATVPEWLTSLKSIRKLDLAHNQIASLPDKIAKISGLVELDISRNKLEAVPECIGSLKSLEVLDLDGNILAELPEFLGNLTSLKTLYASHNVLTELPEAILRLKDLRNLYLSGNAFAVLPQWLKGLTLLEGLYVNDNVLTELPDCVGKLDFLKYLDYRGNDLVVPPPEVVAQGDEAVISYMRALSQKGEEQWISKLIVAGEAKVGKTSLVKALRGEPHDPNEKMTHDIVVSDLSIDHPARTNIKMHLSTWDFGGQRTYRSAHRFYMTDRSLFLLVFDCREEWNDPQMREWLKAISARASNSAIILVGTNSREHRTGLPIETLRADFPQVWEKAFYVDCNDRVGRIGIQELLTAIRECAAALPLMGVRWPQSWLAAVAAIDDLKENYAPVEEVDAAMQDAQLGGSAIRTNLLAALHHRGDILHFADEPDIADTVVLHPTWVDGHVTKILDSSDVHTRHGLLSQAELKRAWPNTPATLCAHLIGLMEAFDLAYRIDSPSHDDVCIVVDRLPHDPPEYEDLWAEPFEHEGTSEVKIFVDFGGPGLLAGIPTWFIAREHRFTTGKHWRYGALLVDRFDTGCRALLIADEQRGRVEIAVRGLAPINFLSVLKDGLLSPLRQRYPGLAWNIKIPCPCTPAVAGSEACKHIFDEGYLRRLTEKNIPTARCEESITEVPIEQLLYGLKPSSMTQIKTTLDALSTNFNSLSQEVHNAASGMSRLEHLAEVQLAALDFQTRATELQLAQSQRCPSVFTLSLKPKSRLHQRIGMERYALNLFCEQPGQWHALPDEAGLFVFTKRPDWLNRSAPFLRVLLSIMEHALKAVGPTLSLTDILTTPSVTTTTDKISDLWSDTRKEKELDAMRALVESLPKGLDDTYDYDAKTPWLVYGDKYPLRRAEDIADFRSLRIFLKALADRDGRDQWGGLIPMTTPEGLAVFVCAHHAKQYEFPRNEKR